MHSSGAYSSWLLLLAAASVCLSLLCPNWGANWGASATELSVAARAAHDARIAAHLEHISRQRARLEEPSPEETHERWARKLQTPAVIRIQAEYQITSLTSAQQQLVKSVVATAVLTLQQLISVKVPIGANGLLAAPQYVGTEICAAFNNPAAPENTCDGAGLAPSFDTSLPSTDIKRPFCNAAAYNASHVLSASCINSNLDLVPGCTQTAAGDATGSPIDLVVYVTSDSDSCTGVAAFATPCLYDLDTNRPVIGMFNICPVAINTFSFDQLLSTTVHEIIHAMGFLDTLFPLFIDASNNLLGYENVVTIVPTAAGSARSGYKYVNTSRVVTEVRVQFDCPTLVGAPLEDNGGDGSAHSHWEYEIFQGDLLTATKPMDLGFQRISRVTLALLEDSGWYIGDYTYSGSLDWGYHAGCSFVQDTCTAYVAAVPTQIFFCSASSSPTQCTPDGRSRGTCQAIIFSSCAMVTSYDGFNGEAMRACTTASDYTNMGSSFEPTATSEIGWAIGYTARCAQLSLPVADSSSGLTVQLDGSPSSAASCWSASCDASGALTYALAGATVTCTSGAAFSLTSLNVDITQGAVTCPIDTVSVCRSLQCGSTDCDLSGGDCFVGACLCHLGWTGARCSTSLRVEATVEGSSTKKWIIIGASVGGGLLVLAIMAALVYVYMRKNGAQIAPITDENVRPVKMSDEQLAAHSSYGDGSDLQGSAPYPPAGPDTPHAAYTIPAQYPAQHAVAGLGAEQVAPPPTTV
ncbi:hypothetical protein FOA52_004477 [Chlamydomonas sp. UWO 241]|nr:hypothetical protein FOA52_004477 [Chlamydomonas sp. UWO 241]